MLWVCWLIFCFVGVFTRITRINGRLAMAFEAPRVDYNDKPALDAFLWRIMLLVGGAASATVVLSRLIFSVS
jgi:hypothetical protein